ncbi:MAG: efflux RND transporter periplasmic adaptor subunit [Ruminiclostridium sp.]|nr:efflux RND transporter periplasmic adaptor subunit [Ruminiclostridium sp.]
MIKARLTIPAAVLAVIMSLSGCYFFPEEEKLLDPPVIAPDEVAYSTFTARRKTIESTINVTGYVKSKKEAECYFTAYTGQIKNVYVRAGDFVKEGDLIAEMNVGELEYLLKIQELEVEAAKLRYSASGSQTDKLDLEIAQNTLEMYQARYDGAKVFAPMSGQVSYVYRIDPGTEFDPYKVIARIVDPDDLYAAASYDGDMKDFAVGDKVTVTVESDEYECTVFYTPHEAAADGADDKKALYADFNGTAPSFAYLGSIANIKKVKSIAENAVVIPKNLIKTDGDRTYVQVFENGEKKDKDVTIGITNATEAEITGGLEAGEAVIIR